MLFLNKLARKAFFATGLVHWESANLRLNSVRTVRTMLLHQFIGGVRLLSIG